MATRIYDCSLDTDLLTGMRLAKVSLGRNELVVLPTDTVYGLGCDAFSAKVLPHSSLPRVVGHSLHRRCLSQTSRL